MIMGIHKGFICMPYEYQALIHQKKITNKEKDNDIQDIRNLIQERIL